VADGPNFASISPEMKIMRRFLILIAAMLGVAGLAAFVFRTFGHHALESYVAELRSKGEKVTLKEQADSLSANTNDSMFVLMGALTNLGRFPADFTNVNGMKYVEPGRAEAGWKLAAPPWKNSTAHGRINTWEGASRYIAQSAEPLSQIRKALKTPAGNAGPRNGDNFYQVTKEDFHAAKDCAEWLSAAALVELHNERRAEGLADIQALAGLANEYREEYSLMWAAARLMVAQKGLEMTWEALQATNWTPGELSSLQRSWEDVDLLGGLERGLESERGFGMAAVERYSAEPDGKKNPLMSPVFRWTIVDNDLKFGLGHLQKEVEAVRALQGNRPYPEVSETFDRLNGQIEKKFHGPLKFFYVTTLTTSKNMKSTVLWAASVETERRLAITAIAIARYQQKHGTPPARLRDLVPEFLNGVPLDCMSGKELCYRLKPGAGFVLYSVGEDGKDDGGDSGPSAPEKKPGLWTGRDAVWPKAQDYRGASGVTQR
jgi:hypothetical protein